MKKISILLFSFMLFLGGCSQKSKLFNEDALGESALMNTQKGELYSSLELKASLTATYLNNFVDEYKKSKDEVFLVSIYIDRDSSDKSKQGIYNKNYMLTLNSKKPIDIKLLEYEDDIIKIIPFRNHWSNYYLLSFEKSKAKEMHMNYKHSTYGQLDLVFSKDQ
jgi:hypothetical protein